MAYLGGQISLFLGLAAGGVIYVLLLQADPGGGRAGAPARHPAAARHREVARLMRLVILTPHDLDTGAGGIERFTRSLIPPLERRGWSTRVIWPRPGDARVPMPVEKAGAAPIAAAFRTWCRHREEIAEADAVLANGVMGWCVSHPRLVVVFHANFGGYAKAIRPSVSFAEYVRNRYVHGGFMAVGGARGTAVEVSRQNASEMRRYYGLRRVAVVENGITPGSFAGGDGEAARRRHGLPEGRIALFPGRVEYRKGADLLRALPPLLPPRTTLVVAGPRALDAPDAIDLGPQGAAELRDLYAAADVAGAADALRGVQLLADRSAGRRAPVGHLPPGARHRDAPA